MGIYSEILREKELNGLKIEQAADQALLKGSAVPVSFDHAEKVREAVAEILKKMQITPREIRGFTNTEELLDVMLDPENILYEKISLSDKTWRSQTNLILAFDESGDPRILYPTLIGYRCKEPGARGSKSCGSKVKLQEEAYVIFRPLKGDSFSLGSFIGLMIRLLSLSDIALIVLASLAVTILGLVAPNVNKQVLSRAVEIGEGAIPYLLGSAAVFVLAGILKGFFGIVKNFLINRMKQRISSQMQSAVMAKLLLLPIRASAGGAWASFRTRSGTAAGFPTWSLPLY